MSSYTIFTALDLLTSYFRHPICTKFYILFYKEYSTLSLVDVDVLFENRF